MSKLITLTLSGDRRGGVAPGEFFLALKYHSGFGSVLGGIFSPALFGLKRFNSFNHY
jgi:hypothetical protein